MAGKKVLRVPYLPLLEAQESADGVRHLLDDKGCVSTISEVNWAAEYPYRPLTTFSVGHSGRSLYIDFLGRCNFLRAVNEADQSPVSQDSCRPAAMAVTGTLSLIASALSMPLTGWSAATPHV